MSTLENQSNKEKNGRETGVQVGVSTLQSTGCWWLYVYKDINVAHHTILIHLKHDLIFFHNFCKS